MEPAQALAFLRSRRSVRRFLPQTVPEDLVETVLETATWAPSAHHRQPWRFVVLEGEAAKERLAEYMGVEFRGVLERDGLDAEAVQAQVERSRQRIVAAPVGIVLCLDPLDMDLYPDPARQAAEHQMAVQSVALCGGTLLLAAHAVGLGGVWVCAPLFAPEAVRQALDLPTTWEPQGLFLLGYPAKIPDPRPRLPFQQVVRYCR